MKVIKSKMMQFSGRVACISEKRNAYRPRGGNLKERGNLEDPNAEGRVILTSMFRKYGVRPWTGFIWLRIGPMVDRCKHGNETSGSMICGEFHDGLRNF